LGPSIYREANGQMTKKMFDGVVLISFLTMMATGGLLKSWSRRHLAQGSSGATGNAAGTVGLVF
jgi:hypothetical protein